MNRKKKIKQTLIKKAKKANAKLAKNSKPKYISKAERAKLVEAADETSTTVASSSDQNADEHQAAK
mgnify:CR=1 FL=1